MSDHIFARIQAAGRCAGVLALLLVACSSPTEEMGSKSGTNNKLCGGTDDDDNGGSGVATPAWTRILANVYNADIAADASDNLLLAGQVYSPPADLGGIPLTEQGMFVAKLDPGGQPLWARPLGDWDVFSIAVDSADNILVLGRSPHYLWSGPPPDLQTDAIYLGKFNPNGELIWNRTMSGTLGATVSSLNMVVDPAGDVLMAFVFRGELDLGGGTLLASQDIVHLDLCITQFDPGGALLHVQHFKSTGSGYLEGYLEGHIATHPSGRILLSGALNVAVDLGGMMLPAGHESTAFVAAVDTYGAALWGKSFPSPQGGQSGIRSTATAGGDVVVAGTFDGPADFGAGPLPFEGTDSPFLIHLDASGNYVDSRGYPGASATLQDLVTGPAGGFALSGWFSSGTLDFGGEVIAANMDDRDAFVVKFNEAGAHTLTHGATGTGEQEGRAIAFSPSEHLYVAASYRRFLEANGQVLLEAGTLLAAIPP